jgi:exopolyphosphatase/guanosine-5'-triphosphate,3'-diphosphate pyrophosphatase
MSEIESRGAPLGEVPATRDTIVAVDLGSNSFHLSVARLVTGEPHVVDRLRERVALAEGLGIDKRLSRESRERALACLRRFGERLRDVPRENVRAVGTSALRQAHNARSFLDRAQEALGHEIEVISGHEEARLIYLGVAHDVALAGGRRLVIDIGGGSTECIVGEGFEILRTDSLHMGCVNFTERFFGSGRLSAKAFEHAELAARIELEPVMTRIREHAWEHCVGSSGTMLSIGDILRANGWSTTGIDLRALRKLRKAMITAGHIDQLELPGLQPERRPVLAGGLAILIGSCTALGIGRITTSTSALRDGLLYDILGRIRHEDVRERAVRDLAARYHLDQEQAERVAATALMLFERLAPTWKLLAPEDARLLSWAASLHEIGLSIAFGGHHHHGAYIVSNTNLPGFSRDEQARLAALILSHRRKLSRERIAELSPHEVEGTLLLSVPLRLAVALNRSRSARRIPPIEVLASKGRLRLGFPPGWLAENPMTSGDLAAEALRLAAVGLRLDFATSPLQAQPRTARP